MGWCRIGLGLWAALLVSCSPGPSPADPPASGTPELASVDRAGYSRTIRLSATLDAVRSTRVVVPQLTGPNPRMTLTRLVPNGEGVSAGEVIATFDPVEQIDMARQSSARYEDLAFQVRQKEADNAAARERRRSQAEQAEADLARALLEVSKAEVISPVEAEQNELRAEKARLALESLGRTQPEEERRDQAALRVLELRRDRERANFERAEANLERLQVRAPIGGMVALATRYSGGTVIRPQEGDQMTRNNALLGIFDPTEMLVRANVAEPDGAWLHPGLEAIVYVDAYPDLALRARFESASPVAAPALSRPVKTFSAVFRLEESDPRLMPDLSAAVVFEVVEEPPGFGR